MLPKKCQSCMMLLIYLLLDASGMPKQWTGAATAYGKELQPSPISEKRMGIASPSGTRVLLNFASLVDTTNPSGLLFCVAIPSADATALTNGLNWACGPGSANCTPIQPGQPCYEANNLTALASYAYNDYYQRTRASGGSCSFNNTAMTTTTDPSHGSCIFTSSTGASTNTNTSTGTNISPSPTTTPTSTGSPGTNTFFDGSAASPSPAARMACALFVMYHFLCNM